MRPTVHLMAETKRHISPKSIPHPVASQTKTPRPGATRRTCETYWKTRQDIQGRSTDHGGAPTRDDERHAGYTKSKSDQAEYSRQDSCELHRDIARHRGATHPLCVIDEVMDHEFPPGFKPVNIESYDGTIDPVVRIEDFFSTFIWPAEMIYMPPSIFPLSSKDLPGTG